MSTFYTHNKDKKSGDGLAITDWNKLSNAVAGNQGLHLALKADAKVGIGTTNPDQNVKLEVNGKVKATHFEGNGASLTGLNASNITTGTLAVARIPNLDASKITGEITLAQLSQEIKDFLLPKVGDRKFGGIVFKINDDGCSGLVCAVSDQGHGTKSECDILCQNCTEGGFNDWRLPTRHELTLMYNELYKTGLAVFNGRYNGDNNGGVWNQHFSEAGESYGNGAHTESLARAVRAF